MSWAKLRVPPPLPAVPPPGKPPRPVAPEPELPVVGATLAKSFWSTERMQVLSAVRCAAVKVGGLTVVESVWPPSRARAAPERGGQISKKIEFNLQFYSFFLKTCCC